MLVHDEHPDYFTSQWAETQQLPTIRVQHHHAHVVAAMLEHGWLDRTVLGIAWDGTGFGPDGTVWGGEFLQADSSQYKRVATLLPFALPSGERAVREPWRVATSVVQQALGNQRAAALTFPNVSQQDVQLVVASLARGHRWPMTSSAGRVFDAVAALVLGQSHCDFEGQAAMLLEAACDCSAVGEYPLPIVDDAPAMLDWRPLICAVLDDLSSGVTSGTIAMRFLRSLAGGIARLAAYFPDLPIVLCGGCFYNRVLTELVVERIGSSRQIGTPGIIPVGDGGLAAGQLAVAAARLARASKAGARLAGATSCA
jgi:hydrogenase maturation protein HypF